MSDIRVGDYVTPQHVTIARDIQPGDRIKFAMDNHWWTVREADGRYVILTKQRPFHPKGELLYTIIDWGRGRRGPCNLIGQSWDVEEPGGCASLLRALNLERGEENDETGDYLPAVQISHRNNVPIDIVKVDQKKVRP